MHAPLEPGTGVARCAYEAWARRAGAAALARRAYPAVEHTQPVVPIAADRPAGRRTGGCPGRRPSP